MKSLMGKHLFLIVAAGFFVLSCDQNKNVKQSRNETKADHETPQYRVSLSVALGSFRSSSIPDTLSVEMRNSTRDTITTGLHYDIQKLKNKDWVKVLPEQPFQDIGVMLLPSGSKFFTVRTMKDKTAYHPGRYRVVKYYLKPDFRKSRAQFLVYAEFYVE